MKTDDFFIWHDKEIRFDVPRVQIVLHKSEIVFDTMANIEDTKGKNGDVGTLIFTNLRIIWYLQSDIKLNLSIGYDCILGSEIRSTSSKVTGDVKALSIKCKFNNNRFEFVFNAVSSISPQLFSTFDVIYRAYDTSRLYREVKLKGFLNQDKNLITLPKEKVFEKTSGVISINNDQVLNGTLYQTNVRIVWYSNTIENLNVSLPWILIASIKPKEINKFGKILSIETTKISGEKIFNFKLNENLDKLHKEITENYKTYSDDPVLGVDADYIKLIENASKSSSNLNVKSSLSDRYILKIKNSNNINKLNTYQVLNSNEEVEVIETNYFNDQSNIFYYMTNQQDKKNTMTDVIYSAELGLAIERFPENNSIESLWRIII